MPKNDPSAQLVTDLLTERKKLEGWLARLDATADASKAAVAGKVRADYQTRLDEVTRELGQYGDGLHKQRETHAKSLDGLRRQEQARSEEMAEAELRHAVGEYSEAEWKEKRAGITAKLSTIRTSLAEAESAIASLDEVLASIAGQEAPEEPEPQPEPRPRAQPKAGQTEAFGNELEFLKSVSDDDKDGPSPQRASGSIRIPEEVAPPSPPPPEPKRKTPASVVKDSGESSVGESRPSVMNQRTLECRECGSRNLPTEWYCEKCGAELAAL